MNDTVTTPAPTPPVTPPIAPPAAPPAQATGSWLDSLSPEDRAYAENKGWKADTPPDAVFNSYKNLEKLFGADKAGRTLTLPKDASDTAALDAIYDKLGRPADPTGYEITLPEGVESDFADKAKGWFHKAGLTVDQAKAVTQAYQAAELEQAQALEQRDATEKAALEKEWGAEFAQKVETAKRGAAAAGLDEEKMRRLELALGPAEAAKMLEFFGRNYVEAKPLDGGAPAPGFGGLNPAQASAKINDLYADQNFMSRYNHSDPKIRAQAVSEMEELMKLAANAKRSG